MKDEKVTFEEFSRGVHREVQAEMHRRYPGEPDRAKLRCWQVFVECLDCCRRDTNVCDGMVR
jgi:hypothetical protein